MHQRPYAYQNPVSLVLAWPANGRVQREGEVMHVIAERLEDLSDLLRSVGERDVSTCLAGLDMQRDPVSTLAAGTGISASHQPPQPSTSVRVPIRDFR